MPDPVKAPPLAMVEEKEEQLKNEIGFDFQSPGEKIETKIKELAYIKAFLEHNEIELP